MIRTGGADKTVHPYFARRMYRLLREQRSNVTYSELPGKEHWWWDTFATNDGGVVNDPVIRQFAIDHARGSKSVAPGKACLCVSLVFACMCVCVCVCVYVHAHGCTNYVSTVYVVLCLCMWLRACAYIYVCVCVVWCGVVCFVVLCGMVW